MTNFSFDLNRDEVLKVINAVLLTILTIVIGLTVGVLREIDDKLDDLSIKVAQHNAEAGLWKDKIVDLEDAMDRHTAEQKKEMRQFRDWAEAVFVRK